MEQPASATEVATSSETNSTRRIADGNDNTRKRPLGLSLDTTHEPSTHPDRRNSGVPLVVILAMALAIGGPSDRIARPPFDGATAPEAEERAHRL